MTHGWRKAAADAERFFALLGVDTVDRRLERIAAASRAILHSREAGFYRNRSADIARWAVRHLDLCARTFCRPPPVELVQLIEQLLGVSGPERGGQRKNRGKFIAAAEHVARDPGATPSKIRRAIKYDQKAVIAGWLEDREFRDIVAQKRARILYMAKKSQQG